MLDFRNYLESQGFASSTIADHLRTVQNFTAWCEKSGLSPKYIQYNGLMAYVEFLKARGSEPGSINTRIRSLKHYFQHLVDTEQREDNPANLVQLKGEKKKVTHRFLTDKELVQLYTDYARFTQFYRENEQQVHNRNTVLLGLIVFQALQSTQLQLLEQQHFDLHNGTVYIPATRRTNDRTLPLAARQVLPLHDYFRELEQSRLFTLRMNDVLGAITKKLGQLVGHPITLQELRASRITHWLQHYNIREAQYFSGFRTIGSLEKYRTEELKALEEQVRLFHPLG